MRLRALTEEIKDFTEESTCDLELPFSDRNSRKDLRKKQGHPLLSLCQQHIDFIGQQPVQSDRAPHSENLGLGLILGCPVLKYINISD